MNEPKQVIIARTDTTPKMRKGKLAAQVSHASMKVIFDMMGTKTAISPQADLIIKTLTIIKDSPIDNWVNGIFKKVVVGATLNEIIIAHRQAIKLGIPTALIEDKGLTEFGGNVTITACAIGPDDPEKIDPITGHLKLL